MHSLQHGIEQSIGNDFSLPSPQDSNSHRSTAARQQQKTYEQKVKPAHPTYTTPDQ